MVAGGRAAASVCTMGLDKQGAFVAACRAGDSGRPSRVVGAGELAGQRGL